MNLVTSSEMQEIDRRAQAEFGIPEAALMESAALSGWTAFVRHAKATRRTLVDENRLLVVCGKGHNAGDALVMARYAALDGWKVNVLVAVPPSKLTGLPKTHLESLSGFNVESMYYEGNEGSTERLIAEAAVILDGMAGTGISGALRSPMDTLSRAVTESPAFVVSVDTPSGLSDSWAAGMPAVRADVTLSMGLPKRSLYQPAARGLCGDIVHVPVPFPPVLTESDEITGTLVSADSTGLRLSPLPASSYKKNRGTVVVYAGERGKAGAAMLAAEAALSARAGLVHLIVDPEIYPSVASAEHSVMVHPRTSHWEAPSALPCALVGSGWGTGLQRTVLVKRLLGTCDHGVIDADGINLLAAMDPVSLGTGWVLTPHIGELARLLQKSTDEVSQSLTACVLEAATRWNCVVVGKSHVTHVAAADGRYTVVDGMNEAMGTGGSGDVLAGAIAGLLAGGVNSYEAAVNGVVLHQMAGRYVRRTSGFFQSEELLAEIRRLVDQG